MSLYVRVDTDGITIIEEPVSLVNVIGLTAQQAKKLADALLVASEISTGGIVWAFAGKSKKVHAFTSFARVYLGDSPDIQDWLRPVCHSASAAKGLREVADPTEHDLCAKCARNMTTLKKTGA